VGLVRDGWDEVREQAEGDGDRGRLFSGRTLMICVGVEAGQWDAAQRLWLSDGLLLGLLEGLCVGLGLQEVVVET
jgi:hypothetical protein